MNAAETIAAAIEKLEQVRTTPVPPTALLTWAQRSPAGAAAANYIIHITSEHGVDAQLAILRSGLVMVDKPNLRGYWAQALDLARAILGEPS